MKKTIIAGMLLATTGFAHAGLLDAVTETATAVTSSQEAGLSTEQAVTALLKTKFQENVTTKEQVKETLGEPKSTATKDSAEVWTYDMDNINSKLSSVTAIAKALGEDTSKAEKVVEMTFNGDVMKTYAIVDAAG